MAVNIFCEACGKAGLTSKMSPLQLNMHEALLVCDNSECVFPLGTAREGAFIMSRKAEEMISKNKRNKYTTYEKIQSSQQGADQVIYWENIDALCWLDSTLGLLVYNTTIKQLLSRVQTSENSLLKYLLDQYAKAQYLAEFDVINARKILEDVRSLVWKFLCPKMKCTLGVNDSPLFALPLLLRENPNTADNCMQEYQCEFSCQVCGHTQTSSHKKHVVTLPNTPKNFSLQQASFQRTCHNCDAKDQYSRITHQRVPDVLFFHFVEGLNCSDYLDYQFHHKGCTYQLTQFIQYTNDPDHFICWSKHSDGSRWLNLDDLKPSIHHWSSIPPKVPPSQVHLIVLQKLSPPVDQQHMNTNQDIPQHKTESSLHETESFVHDTESFVHDTESIVHETIADNATIQDIVCELEQKLAIDTQDKPNENSCVDCNSNRLPLKNLNTPNSTRQVSSLSTIKRCQVGRTLSAIPKSTGSLFRVAMKRLSSDNHFHPLLPKKRRSQFQPYVPKKERTFARATSETEKNCEDLLSPVSPCSLLDSHSDSGYSSPSSVSSCSSSITSNLGKDESIADQLEKLLPDCLENAVPIKDMSTNQDDIIQQLLFNE